MRISDWSSDVCSSDLSRNCPSMTACYVRHHLSLNRRLRPAVRQGQFLHSSQTSAGHRRRKIGRYSFAIVGSSQAFHGYQKRPRSEEHTSELQSLMRISYAVFCLKKKKTTQSTH